MTRWHGTTTATGLRLLAVPTARTAPGGPAAAASCAVRGGLAVGDAPQGRPHLLLERRAGRADGDVELLPLAREVLAELADGLHQHGVVGRRLAVRQRVRGEQQLHQGAVRGLEQQVADRAGAGRPHAAHRTVLAMTSRPAPGRRPLGRRRPRAARALAGRLRRAARAGGGRRAGAPRRPTAPSPSCVPPLPAGERGAGPRPAGRRPAGPPRGLRGRGVRGRPAGRQQGRQPAGPRAQRGRRAEPAALRPAARQPGDRGLRDGRRQRRPGAGARAGRRRSSRAASGRRSTRCWPTAGSRTCSPGGSTGCSTCPTRGTRCCRPAPRCGGPSASDWSRDAPAPRPTSCAPPAPPRSGRC